MEFITGGDLMFHAQKVERFSEEQTRFIIAEVCEGLWFLHEHGIIYRYRLCVGAPACPRSLTFDLQRPQAGQRHV
jgi:hypothetical protein